MPAKILPRLLIIAFILGAQVFMLPLAPVQVVQAQGETFSISTPYYGSKQIRSYFDHSAPTYTPTNNLFVKYDGHSWTGNVSISNCTNDLNCYDGNNGLDIGMAYEHVLAAAEGAVTMARWNVTNCHNGVGCNYGLEVRIRHIVNDHTYLTNYGHLTTLAVQVGQSIVINVARDVAFDPGQVIASHVTAPCG